MCVELGSMHQHQCHQLAHHFVENFCIHIKCEVKHNEDMGMEHLWFKWVGQLWQSELLFCFVLGDVGIGHLWFKWVGHLWQSELLFRFVLGNMLKKCWSSGK